MPYTLISPACALQVQALQGARLPETEEEWRALEAGLAPAARFLRSDTSVARLCCELRDFVQLLQLWWANRKRGEGERWRRGCEGLCHAQGLGIGDLLLWLHRGARGSTPADL